MKYYKILNKAECHNGLQYKTGLNIDPTPFNPSGDCESGGIYFSREDIFAFLYYGPYIREVILPEDAKVYENPGTPKKWKADKVILKRRRKINLKVIKELVAEGADIRANDNAILIWACRYGYLAIVKYLVNDGVDTGARGNDALVSASANGHLAIVKYLVKSGADVIINNNEALKRASLHGYFEIVKYLVEAGANVGAGGNIALFLASASGHLKIVKYLKSLK